MSKIQIATVQLWSDSERTPEANRSHALAMAQEAASASPDLILLPESISMLCYPDGREDFTYHDVSESVPGSTTDELCRIAKHYNTNIVAGLIADRGFGNHCQNLAVVIDRAGTIVGTYEKVHEPRICRDEQAAGVGSQIPVFDLDIGRIGVMICWDLISPEIANILALKGAELILFPHMIGLPTVVNFEIQVKARAIDAGVPIVLAGMRDDHSHSGDQDGFQATCVVGAGGEVLAEADGPAPQIVWVELDPSANTVNGSRVLAHRGDLRFDVYAAEYLALSNQEK